MASDGRRSEVQEEIGSGQSSSDESELIGEASEVASSRRASRDGSPHSVSRSPARDIRDDLKQVFAEGSRLQLSEQARAQVGSLLCAIASKYVGVRFASQDGQQSSSANQVSASSFETDPSAGFSQAGADECAEESHLARPATALRASRGPSPSHDGADESMHAYAQWLKAELAAESAGEVEDEPDEPQADAGPALADELDKANPGALPSVAPPTRELGPSARAANPTKRRVAAKRRPSAPAVAQRAERAPSRISVSVRCAVLVGREVWVVARDTGSIMIYDARSAAHRDTVLCLHHMVTAMAAATSQRTRTVWAGTESGSVLLYDAATRGVVREITRQHAGAVQAIAVQRAPSASGGGGAYSGLVVSGGSDRRLCVWDAKGSLKKAYQGHAGAVRCVLILGAHIWSGGDDGTVRVWDLAHAIFHLARSEACVAELRGEHSGAVRALLPTGPGHVISASDDGSVCKWEGAPHFSCVLRVVCAGTPTALMPMGLKLWVCCGRAGIEVRDCLSLQLCETLPAANLKEADGGGVGALGALRVHAVERRTAWTWMPNEPHGTVWEREEGEATLSVDEYAAALAQAEAAAQQLDEHFRTLAQLRTQTRNEALRALAVKAALAHELEGALALCAAKARELDALSAEFMAQQAADLDEQRQLHALCEQLEATNARQQAAHALALREAAEREAALRRELLEAQLERERAREERDEAQGQLSEAFCERDMLRLRGSQLQLELHETRSEVSTLRRNDATVSAFLALASSTSGSAAVEASGEPATPRSATVVSRAHMLGAESLLRPSIAEGAE